MFAFDGMIVLPWVLAAWVLDKCKAHVLHVCVCVSALDGLSEASGAEKQNMKDVYKNNNYILDPHGSIGYLASENYLKNNNHEVIFLETAHPCKFLDDVENAIETKIDLPPSIKEILNKEKQSHTLDNSFASFKAWMLS